MYLSEGVLFADIRRFISGLSKSTLASHLDEFMNERRTMEIATVCMFSDCIEDVSILVSGIEGDTSEHVHNQNKKGSDEVETL